MAVSRRSTRAVAKAARDAPGQLTPLLAIELPGNWASSPSAEECPEWAN